MIAVIAVMIALIAIAMSFFAGVLYEKTMGTRSEHPRVVLLCRTGVVFHTLSNCPHVESKSVRRCELCDLCRKKGS